MVISLRASERPKAQVTIHVFVHKNTNGDKRMSAQESGQAENTLSLIRVRAASSCRVASQVSACSSIETKHNNHQTPAKEEKDHSRACLWALCIWWKQPKSETEPFQCHSSARHAHGYCERAAAGST